MGHLIKMSMKREPDPAETYAANAPKDEFTLRPGAHVGKKFIAAGRTYLVIEITHVTPSYVRARVKDEGPYV